MSKQWTTTIHDASELPKKYNAILSVEVFGEQIIRGDDTKWVECYYFYGANKWLNANREEVNILRWCEKPPVQKKKTKKIIELHVWRAESESGYIADTISMNRPIPYLGKFPIEIEE